MSPSQWNLTEMEEQSETRPKNVAESNWFQMAQERGPWRAQFRLGLNACTEKQVHSIAIYR